MATEEEKKKLREGDSARARTYRLKDEVLEKDGFFKNTEFFKTLEKAANPRTEEVVSLFRELRTVLDKLDKEPECEDHFNSGASVLDKLSKIRDEVVAGQS